MCCHTPQDKKEKKAYVITRNGHVFKFNNNYSECKSVRLSSTSETWYIRHQLQKSPMFMLHTIFPPHLTPFVSLGLHMCRCFSALLFTSSHQKEEAKRPHFENYSLCLLCVKLGANRCQDLWHIQSQSNGFFQHITSDQDQSMTANKPLSNI